MVRLQSPSSLTTGGSAPHRIEGHALFVIKKSSTAAAIIPPPATLDPAPTAPPVSDEQQSDPELMAAV